LLDAFLDWLAGLPTLATYASLILLSALENVFPPVPADVAVALGAFLARRGEIDALLLGGLCWLANCGSAAWTYFLGRRHGTAFFASGWRRKLLPPEAMQALHDAYQRYGVVGIFVSRFLPGVRAAVTPFAGVAGLGPLRALVPAAIASAIWYALLIFAGTALGLQWTAIRDLVERVMGALSLAGALALVAAIAWLWRRRKAARAAR
jgi:membrane protein DedA with SNARE-associated domain